MPRLILTQYCETSREIYSVICDDEAEVKATLKENCPRRKACPHIVEPLPEKTEAFVQGYMSIMERDYLADEGFKSN